MGRKIKECNHCHLLKPTHGHGYCSTCCAGLRKNSSFIPYNLRPDIPKFTPCSVWDCNEQIRRKIHVGLYAGKSYCEKHGWAIKQYGEPLDKTNGSGLWYFPEPKEPYISPKCSIKNCNFLTQHKIKVGLYAGKSYCYTHGSRINQLGNPIISRKMYKSYWVFPEETGRKKCSLKYCNNNSHIMIRVGLYAGKSYCSTHGNRIKCYGEPLEYYQKHWWFPEDIWCKEQYCDNFCQYGLDLCTKHRQRLTKFGDTSYSNYTCCVTNCQNKTIDANKKSSGFCYNHTHKDNGLCIVDNCNKPILQYGRCVEHSWAWRQYGSFMKRIFFPEEMYCKVKGCDIISKGSSYCNKHWTRLNHNGTTELLPTLVSKPMKKFEKLCNEYGITIDEKEKKIGIYPVDYVIKNIVVQIDGDYFHANPKMFLRRGKLVNGYKPNDMIFDRTTKEIWIKDKRRDKISKEAGYEVIRFWESDITHKPEQCMKYLLSRLEFTLTLNTRNI